MKRLWKLPIKSRPLTDFYVFDTETAKRQKGNKLNWCLDGEFIFGVIYGYNYVKVIYDKEHLKRTLKEDRFRGRKIFAHNCEFDGSVVYDNIIKFDPMAIFNGKLITFTNGVCSFANSSNIFIGQSVARIGAMLGLDKGNLGNSNYVSIGITQKDIAYCIRDCEIIWHALLKTFEFAGDIKITQASLSMTYYRRFHQPYHIDHNENTRFFWDSYFGGRCEAFKIGKTHAKVIDMNSAYSYAMRTSKFPNPRSLKVEHDISVFRAKKYMEHFEGCIKCDVFHPETISLYGNDSYVGSLPVKKDNKLIFPVGNLTGTWNFNELRYAIEVFKVKIKRVHYICYADPIPSPFVSYVDTLNVQKIKARSEGDLFTESMVKYYLNMLYGKFAQKIDEEQIYIADYEKQWKEIQEYQKNNTFIRMVPFNHNRKDCFIVVKNSVSYSLSYSIPSFASYITSFQRVELLKKMVAMKYNRVVYCDTDSIAFEIDNGHEDEKQLGGWKVESKIITHVGGLKNYKYKKYKDNGELDKEVWRIKGVPIIQGRKTKIVTGEFSQELDTVSQTSGDSFVYYNISKTKEALRRGLDTRKIMKREKTIKGTYDKRVVLKNGKTKPILL